MQHLLSNLKLNRQQDGEPSRQSSPTTSSPTTPEATPRTRSRSLQDDIARSPRRTERYTPVTLAQAVELEQLMGGGTARDAERRLQRRQARAQGPGPGAGVELGTRDEHGVLWRSAAEREEHLGLLSNRIGHGRQVQQHSRVEEEPDGGSSSSGEDQLEFPILRRHPSEPALPSLPSRSRHGSTSLPMKTARDAFFADAFAPSTPRESMQTASAPATPASGSFARAERHHGHSRRPASPSLTDLLAGVVPPNSPASPSTPGHALKSKQSFSQSFKAFAKKFRSRDTLQERLRQEKMGHSAP
ncbi:hypothetical protein AURDEDRAFT_120891 [Auricularia subglabra TFB-10046 SS5]|nr:hypothetical protein AURDEDRAFT_120891 [Auricularia subglabra TFB-10046 SS5]